MKKYLILLAMMFMGNVVRADNSALRINLDGGTTATYILASKPVVTYEEGNVTIKNAELEDTYPLAEVKSFAFVNDVTSLPSVGDGNVTYRFSNNLFTCEGHDISVYDLSGTLVAAGKNEVSLATLGNGIYVVSVAGRSVKIFKN